MSIDIGPKIDPGDYKYIKEDSRAHLDYLELAENPC